MRCPFCGHGETKVIDKRVSEEKVNRRRRECLKCKKRFTTYEKIENLITKIKKRDGRVVNFDQKKITEAIWKAAQAVGGSDREIAESLSSKVAEILEEKFGGVTVPTVEQVQDIVEKTLVENGHYKTAKAYILYREKHKKIRETRDTFVEVDETIKSYLDRLDWRVKENSNEQYSFSGLLLYAAGRVMSNYNLNEIHTQAVAEAHKKGYIHIHDLSHGVIGYCCGHSLKNLLLKGFGGVPNKVDCKPAKHLSTVVHQMVNYIGCLQMEFAGAQAFNSIDSLLAPFVKTDKLTYKQVKQNMQQLVFSLNIPSRWGSQYPFSNVTFDWVCPKDMNNEKAIVGGKPQGFTYSDCQKEMDMINRAFIEVMLEGDANGRIFSFPIPTYNITKDFDWDSENAKLLFEMTAKYGTPYFQNYIGSNLDPSSIRAMCCRLNINQTELLNRPGGMWSIGDSTGSIGVVTMNLNRFAYEARKESKDPEDARTLFLNKLSKYMLLARDSLEIKRKVVERNMKNGLMPYTRVYLGTFRNHFSTIGLCGMNEACLNLLGKDISTPEGKALAIETLNFMRDLCLRFQKETGNLYNLEATPAESTSYRLAKLDKEMYPDIITAGRKEPYLTNSTQLPVDYTDDPIEAIEHQNDIQPLYTGGCVDANTKIFTNRGIKKIKEIVGKHKGLRVLSYNEKAHTTEFKKIEDSMYVDVDKDSKLKIIMGCGTEIITSDWHPFYVINQKLDITTKRADEITGGDFILSVTNGVCNGATTTKLPEDFSWLIGVLVSDGYLGKKYIGIANQDKNILNEIKRILKEKYGKEFPQYGRAKEVRIHDKKIRHELLKVLGMKIGPKSFTAILPADFRKWTQRQRFRLLCGMIDGDGNVPKSGKHIRICTASNKMIEELTELSYSLGMRSFWKKRGKYYYLFLNRRAYKDYIGLFKKYIINKNKAERLFDTEQNGQRGLKCSVKNKSLYKYNTGVYRTKGRISFELAEMVNKKTENAQGFFVKRIEKVKKDTKFCDLTVKDNHNYLAGNNGMVFVHNTIFHTFLGEKLSSGRAAKTLVRRIAENTRLPYFSLTPTFSICPEHGYLRGEHFKCPRPNGGNGKACNKPTEVFSRIVGYYRPIQNWNLGKQEEFRDRKEFLEQKALAGKFKAAA